jgi:hypothetical protein
MSVWINKQGQKHTVELVRREALNSIHPNIHLTIDGSTLFVYRLEDESDPLKAKHDYNIVCMTLQNMGFSLFLEVEA